jgi:co-chaperonin GroES (HSP10)|tara:strand:- start:4808 stop:5080 length:273 start_codon:yes stop_codon:yes gene_type:complete
MKKIKPIGTYIVLNQIKEEITTDSGLVLSGADAKEIRYKKGKVVESGTDIDVINSGDVIYYDSRAGSEYTMIIDGNHFTVINLRDVVVVV